MAGPERTRPSREGAASPLGHRCKLYESFGVLPLHHVELRSLRQWQYYAGGSTRTVLSTGCVYAVESSNYVFQLREGGRPCATWQAPQPARARERQRHMRYQHSNGYYYSDTGSSSTLLFRTRFKAHQFTFIGELIRPPPPPPPRAPHARRLALHTPPPAPAAPPPVRSPSASSQTARPCCWPRPTATAAASPRPAHWPAGVHGRGSWRGKRLKQADGQGSGRRVWWGRQAAAASP